MDITELLTTPDGAVLAAIGGDVALVTMRHETVNKVTIERFPLGAVVGVDAVLQLLGAHGFSNREPALTVVPVEAPALPAPEDRPHVCPECNQRFTRKDHLKRHLRGLHALPLSSQHSCPECEQAFTTRKGLGHHRSLMHGVAGISHIVLPGDHACPDCPKTFLKQRGLSMHRLRVHGVHAAPRREPITGDHQCPSCDARFETELALSMHEMKVHRVQPDPLVLAKAPETPEPLPVTPESLEPPPPVSLDVAPATEAPSAPVTKDRKVRAVLADGSCPVCHEPLVTHEACDGCGVLVGPGHETEHRVFISGADYCRDCARARITARKAELEAA